MRALPRLSCACALIAASLLSACASSPRQYRSFEDASSPVTSRSGTSASSQSATTGTPLVDVDAAALIATSSDHQKVGNPYMVSGRTYRPVRDDRYDRTGMASWYGPTFHGRRTANGEIFDENLMTAAHTTLPIPSIAEVTNLENGRTIIVRINDRGPFVDDRIIDLSRAAASELGYLRNGLARVRVRYLGPAQANASAPPRGYRNGASGQAPAPATALPAPVEVAATSDVLNAGVGASLEAAHAPAAGARQNSSAPGTGPLPGDVTLQVGAFSDADNAQRFADRIADAGDVWVVPGNSGLGPVFRVYFGRWADRNSAETARQALADRGVYDARIVDMD